MTVLTANELDALAKRMVVAFPKNNLKVKATWFHASQQEKDRVTWTGVVTDAYADSEDDQGVYVFIKWDEASNDEREDKAFEFPADDIKYIQADFLATPTLRSKAAKEKVADQDAPASMADFALHDVSSFNAFFVEKDPGHVEMLRCRLRIEIDQTKIPTERRPLCDALNHWVDVCAGIPDVWLNTPLVPLGQILVDQLRLVSALPRDNTMQGSVVRELRAKESDDKLGISLERAIAQSNRGAGRGGRGGNRGGRGRGSRRMDIVCDNCGHFGHVKRDCYVAANPEKVRENKAWLDATQKQDKDFRKRGAGNSKKTE